MDQVYSETAALVLALFAPAASFCLMLAVDCGYTGKQIETVNSMYLLISVGILSFLMCVVFDKVKSEQKGTKELAAGRG